MPELKVLIADDEVDFLRPLAEELRDTQHWDIDEFYAIADAITAAKKNNYDVAMVDIVFPREEHDGVDFLEMVKRCQKEIAIVMMTGFADVDTAIAALRLGADDYIKKPFLPEEAAQAIRRTFATRELHNRMMALSHLAQPPSLVKGLTKMLQHVVVTAAEGLHKADFLFWANLNKGLKVTVFHGECTDDDKKTLEGDIQQGPARQAVETGEATIVEDMTGAFHAMLAVPVLFERRPVGVLCAASRESVVFSEHDVNFLTSVANIAGIEIERMRHWFAWQKAEADKIRTQAELEAYRVLPPGLAHHMHQPLMVIKGRIQRLLDRVGRLEPNWTRQELEAIRTNTQRIELLADDMLDLTRVARVNLKNTDFKGVLERCIRSTRDDFEAGAQANRIELVARIEEEIPLIAGDSQKLDIAITSILRNAVEAVQERLNRDPEHNGRVQLDAWRERNHITVQIRDNGIGMTEEQKPKVFQPFYTTKEKGHGLGLSLSQLVAAGHGGRMELESQLGKGTTVRLILSLSEGKDLSSRSAIAE